jgi:hypothetical protein
LLDLPIATVKIQAAGFHVSRTAAAYRSQNASTELVAAQARNGILAIHESCDALLFSQKDLL